MLVALQCLASRPSEIYEPDAHIAIEYSLLKPVINSYVNEYIDQEAYSTACGVTGPDFGRIEPPLLGLKGFLSSIKV